MENNMLNTLSLEELAIRNQQLEQDILYLRHENSKLRIALFGQKRERHIIENSQLQLSLDLGDEVNRAEPEEPAQTEHIESYTRKRKGQPTGRQAIPEDIPREEEIVIEPDEDVSGMERIGEKRTEILEYTPGKFHVKVIVRPVYKSRDDKIICAALPKRVNDKGIAGESTLAYIAVSKYVDHLPLHRIKKQFQRANMRVAESTLNHWIAQLAQSLEGLYYLIRNQVLKRDYLQIDETTIKVLDKNKKGKTHLGYYWLVNDPVGRMVFFDYHNSRRHNIAEDILEHFQGYMQSDGYEAYDKVGIRDGVVHLGCMAHARRKFYEAGNTDKSFTDKILKKIQLLYSIERFARNHCLNYDERYVLRKENALPILKQLADKLKSNLTKYPPRNAVGMANGYMYSHMEKLMAYLEDGRLEIDNNLIENQVRPVALGRKNYLFAGSHNGAVRGAIFYTIFATARLNDIEPFEYVKDILKRLPETPEDKLEELLPANWKKQKEAVQK